MTHDFRARLKRRDLLLGTMVMLPSAASAEILANLGFDWLFIDAEHAPIGPAEITGMLQAASHKTACVVRLPEAAEVPIKQILDTGVHGIIAPQVNTAEQAAAVVRWARYSPEGTRGVGLARAHAYGPGFADYLKNANREIAVIVQAEHRLAVENIEAIVAVPGLDAVFVGPYDLSASYGKMGELNDPVVTGAIRRITDVCLEAGMPLGFFGVSAAAVKPYVAQGFTLIVAGADALFLGGGARALLGELKKN